MKKLVFLISIVLMAQMSFAQLFSWGVKGGVNSTKVSFDDFNIDGDFTVKEDYLPGGPNADDLIITVQDDEGNDVEIINPQAINTPRLTFTPSSYEMGYHFGAFARLKLLGIFIQPELLFSHAEAAIDFSDTDNLVDNVSSSTATINYNKFDVPVMVGVKLGPARLNMGPVATFNLSPSVEGAAGEVEDMLDDFTEVTNLATFGAQVGVGVDILKKVTIDVRYEFPISKLGDEVTIGDNTFSTDQRQAQFIGSVGFMF